eukprot:TRINITY_DN47154_c0_g1_i1.p1 TRINITY_DN47154_c0_g1~~TRINITY_DN47154_c0_g1_i1.p1  ORF type:complete len:560 (-),score=89.52 TRINITY_DN47154_c0_g1_i1:272-1951(-)
MADGLPTRSVTFKLEVKPEHVSDSVRLVGSSSALGRWQPNLGVVMNKTEPSGSMWSATVLITATLFGSVEYKFCVLKATGDAVWEEGANRCLPAGVTSVPLAVFNATLGAGSALAQRIVAWEVTCTSTKPGDCLVVVGSLAALGEWDPDKGLKLSTGPSTYPKWSALSMVPSEGLEITWKVAILRQGGRVEWESGGDRYMELPVDSERYLVKAAYGASLAQAAVHKEEVIHEDTPSSQAARRVVGAPSMFMSPIKSPLALDLPTATSETPRTLGYKKQILDIERQLLEHKKQSLMQEMQQHVQQKTLHQDVYRKPAYDGLPAEDPMSCATSASPSRCTSYMELGFPSPGPSLTDLAIAEHPAEAADADSTLSSSRSSGAASSSLLAELRQPECHPVFALRGDARGSDDFTESLSGYGNAGTPSMRPSVGSSVGSRSSCGLGTPAPVRPVDRLSGVSAATCAASSIHGSCAADESSVALSTPRDRSTTRFSPRHLKLSPDSASFASWVMEKQPILRTDPVDHHKRIPWDFPLAKSEKRDLLILGMAAQDSEADADRMQAQ